MINLTKIQAYINTHYGKVKKDDTIAMGATNDPFNVDTEPKIRDAAWFAELFRKVQTADNHLRRAHYRILDLPEHERKLPLTLSYKKNTPKEAIFTHYQNHDRCWEYLNKAATYARWLGLVKFDAFMDNRAKASSFTIASHYHEDMWNVQDPWYYRFSGTSTYNIDDELPDLDNPLPHAANRIFETDIRGNQPLIEIWLEKTEGMDVLEPIAHQYNVNIIPGVGEMSLTNTYQLIERANDRAIRVLYISDFDPAGHNMPFSVGRKVEALKRNYSQNIDFILEPVLLTWQQVQQYDLLVEEVPGDNRTVRAWNERYGGRVELNALFATEERKRFASKLVIDAIQNYRDISLDEQVETYNHEVEAELWQVQKAATRRVAADLQAIATEHKQIAQEWQLLQDAYTEALSPLIKIMSELTNRYEDNLVAYQDTTDHIAAQVEAHNLELDVPEPDLETDRPDEVLIDTERSYLQQLGWYHHHRFSSNGKNQDFIDWLKYDSPINEVIG